MGQAFREEYIGTFGADFALKTMEKENLEIKFQIWDLASQPAWDSVRHIYYKGALGAILVFDITNPESFQNLNNWIDELWSNNGFGPTPLIILGNKIDLRESTQESVSSVEGDKFASLTSDRTIEHGFEIKYIETSALTGENVEKAFEGILKQLLEFSLTQEDFQRVLGK